MKPIVKYALILALFLLALFIAPMLVGEKGYVLIAFKHYTIELTIISLGIIVFTTVFLVIVVLKLIGIGFSASRFALSWFGGKGTRKRQGLFYDSLFALLLGNNEAAKASLEQLTHDEFFGFNYLALGQLAMQQGKIDVAQMWLDKAKLSDDARSVKAAQILIAQMYIQQKEPLKALEELDALGDVNDPDVLRTRTQAMALSNQWQALEEKLPKWKKQLGDTYTQYHEHIATNKFAEIASKQGAIQLKEHWESLPRQQKNDEIFRAALLQQLNLQGMYQDAQDYLIKWYKKSALPTALLEPIKHITLTHPSELIKLLEVSIKTYPEEPSYYATLGHVAFNTGDFVLSEKGLIKAINLKETIGELSLLANVYEKSGKYEQAIESMRRVHALQG